MSCHSVTGHGDPVPVESWHCVNMGMWLRDNDTHPSIHPSIGQRTNDQTNVCCCCVACLLGVCFRARLSLLASCLHLRVCVSLAIPWVSLERPPRRGKLNPGRWVHR